jgi:hypothetical protein
MKEQPVRDDHPSPLPMKPLRETSLRQRGIESPFPFPLTGKAGAGAFPPRRTHAARQPKTLASVDAIGSPHKRAAALLCIPRQCGTQDSGATTKHRNPE